MNASVVSTMVRRYSEPYDIGFDYRWGAGEHHHEAAGQAG